MKLIIDIPDELAKKDHWYTDKEIWTVIKAAQNGIPLDDIRAEIAEIKQLMTEQDCEPSFIRGLEQAVNVIDAHIKAVEE